jgi:hypothetical protein
MATASGGKREVTAAEAGLRLRLSRERVVRLIQTGRLAGRRDHERGWLVQEEALKAFQAAGGPPGGHHG